MNLSKTLNLTALEHLNPAQVHKIVGACDRLATIGCYRSKYCQQLESSRQLCLHDVFSFPEVEDVYYP